MGGRYAPRVRHTKEIAIRARDADASGSIATSALALYFEECRDEWLNVVGGDPDMALAYLIRRLDFAFLRDVDPAVGSVRVTIELDGLGTTSIRLRETLRAGPDDEIAATNHSVLVHVNDDATAGVPLPDDFRARLGG
jgi:acyl-CoA thioesterase FadM